MQSVTIEFLRFGTEPGILRKGDPYLATCGSNPVRQFQMPFDHKDFLQLLRSLRYKAAESERQAALEKLSATVSAILQPLAGPGPEPLQLDLVTSAAELWALPFEAAQGLDGGPLFVDPQRVVVPTRRIRQDFAERTTRWPARLKILFVAASPGWAGPPVPVEAHKEALRAALKPWIEPLSGLGEAIPNEGSVLHILEKASVEAIAQRCQQARAEGKPFTHVHVLAHGWPIVEKDWPYDVHFGLALHSDRQEPTEAQDLVKALKPENSSPIVVTLAVCDAGNETNSPVPVGSAAQLLHRSGVPVVVASQLPLTFDGSTVLTKEFYGALLSGADVRMALHKARVALSKASGTGHDWVSVMGYVQLPEGYADHLLDVRLEAELASLNTAQRWADQIIEQQLQSEDAFNHVTGILQQRIEVLTSFLEEMRATTPRQGVFEENAGLLGSAKKRLAELLFIRGSRVPNRQWLEESRAVLESARLCYLEGHEHNLSHHWTGVQHLSMEAVLTGRIGNVKYWGAAQQAAEIDRRKEKEYWALGSIAELWLLAPLTGQDSGLAQACEALVQMQQRVQAHAPSRFPIESTLRQLRRYTVWWTKANGFFGGCDADLAEDAKRLMQVLEAAQEALTQH